MKQDTGAIENAGTINSIDNASGGVIGGTGIHTE